ncbi:MAG TPA: alpha/beta hydrolase, partial [Acidimicrobiales bacterium]|nr:alpha/beta hydrolase [Acidimicrobiales bacterium]
MPVHPQVQAVLDAVAAAGITDLSVLPVADVRALTLKLARQRAADAPVLAETRDLVIPSDNGAIPARLYRPAHATSGLLVYFHGDGWVIGSVEASDGTCRYLADTAGVAILSVDYRLAPEHPFPAAVDDCWAATEWAAGHSGELGVDALRLAVGGDSAGGNLAAVVSLLARDAGWPDIELQVLVYPAVDARAHFPSMDENAVGYFLTKNDVHWFYDQYGRGSVVSADDWRLSPLLAPTHNHLPPAVVVTAEYDPLRDEGAAYA